MARGDHPGLADDRSISAIETQLTGKDISLDAKRNIDLEAGWNRQSALNHTTQKGLSVGVEASVGTSAVLASVCLPLGRCSGQTWRAIRQWLIWS